MAVGATQPSISSRAERKLMELDALQTKEN